MYSNITGSQFIFLGFDWGVWSAQLRQGWIQCCNHPFLLCLFQNPRFPGNLQMSNRQLEEAGENDVNNLWVCRFARVWFGSWSIPRSTRKGRPGKVSSLLSLRLSSVSPALASSWQSRCSTTWSVNSTSSWAVSRPGPDPGRPASCVCPSLT